MPTINFGKGADGPLASLEVGAKYDTTYFPNDLSEAPYFIVFRAQNKYKMSSLGSTKTKFVDGDNLLASATDYALGEGTSELIGSGVDFLLGKNPDFPLGMPAPKETPKQNAFSSFLSTGIKAVGGFGKALEELGIELSQPAHSFALPIPSNLSTQYNAQYGPKELGALGEIGRDVATNFQATDQGLISDLKSAMAAGNVNGGSFKGVLADLGMGALESDVGTQALVGAALGGIGAAGIAGTLGSLGTGVLRGAGIARNPHIANIFSGVNFRNHTFQYKLIAKNQKESDTIRDLIRNFKYHMAPDYRPGDHVFKYPSQFQIIIRAGDYLFKIADSVLTTFDVNYTGEGGPYFFEDTNAPYSVTINMSFTEDTIVTKQEIRAGR